MTLFSLYRAGWAPGPIWMHVENLAPTGIRSPDRPAHNELLYRLHYPSPQHLQRFQRKNLQTIYYRVLPVIGNLHTLRPESTTTLIQTTAVLFSCCSTRCISGKPKLQIFNFYINPIVQNTIPALMTLCTLYSYKFMQHYIQIAWNNRQV
jgi:hypothetical protein